MPIQLGASLPHLTTSSLPIPSSSNGPNGFAAAIESAISAVESTSTQANQSVQQFLAGDSIDIHSVALAGQRAEVSMELFQQVRNKLVSAYQEIMRSQV